MRKRSLVALLLVSAFAGFLRAQGVAAAISPRKGGSFFVNDQGVRLREGPGTSYKILANLARGDLVVPVEASRLFEREIGDTPGYPWYRCRLGKTLGVTGWIYGKYLGFRFDASDPELVVANFSRYMSDASYDRNGSLCVLLDGIADFDPTYLKEKYSPPTAMRWYRQERGKLVQVGTLYDGARCELDRPDPSFPDYFLATVGSRCVAASSSQGTKKAPSLDDWIKEDISLRFETFMGRKAEWAEIAIHGLEQCDFDLTGDSAAERQKGSCFEIDARSGEFILNLGVFRISRADGSAVYTNSGLSVYKDTGVEAPERYGEKMGNWVTEEFVSAGLGFRTIDGVTVYDSPDAGASIITVSTSGWEYDSVLAFVCDGYVVSGLGARVYGP